LLSELEPLAGELFDRHLAATREWFPHELVPYERARPFDPAVQWDGYAVDTFTFLGYHNGESVCGGVGV